MSNNAKNITPIIPDDEVHIYISSIKLAVSNFDAINKYLTEEEITKLNNYIKTEDKLRFSTARYILKKTLFENYGLSFENIKIRYADYGKPFLQDISPSIIDFNISHSNDLVVVALSSGCIGIDIEKICNLNKNLLNTLILTDDELKYLKLLPPLEASQEFYKIWTAKEAITKMLGTGLYINFNKISLIKKDCSKAAKFLPYHPFINSEKEFYIQDIPSFYNSYCCSVATPNPKAIVKIIGLLNKY